MITGLKVRLSTLKGSQFVDLHVYTDVEIVKGGRLSKKCPRYPNEMANHVITKAYAITVSIGWDYANVFGNRATSGLPQPLKAEEKERIKGIVEHLPKGRKWAQFPYLLASEDNSKEYLRTFLVRDNNPRNLTYFVDGRKATAEETAEIKRTMVRPQQSAKQAAEGLTGQDQVMPRDYAMPSIASITINGQTLWNSDVYGLPKDVVSHFFPTTTTQQVVL